jgi:hypothetical protein
MIDLSSARRRVAAALVVENVRHTHYQHNPVIDPATGTYDLDCSEFVSYLLHGAVPDQYTQIPRRAGGAVPARLRVLRLLSSPRSGWRRRLATKLQSRRRAHVRIAARLAPNRLACPSA